MATTLPWATARAEFISTRLERWVVMTVENIADISSAVQALYSPAPDEWLGVQAALLDLQEAQEAHAAVL